MVRAPSLIALLAMVISSPAHSRDWPEAGGWFISETDDGCGMMMTFEGAGSTQLAFFLEQNGSSGVLISNEAWSTAEGKKYDISYRLNGSVYSGGSIGSNDPSGRRKGFIAKFGPEFGRDFEKASGLTIMKGDVVVDDLSLRGSAAALAVMRRCVGEVSARLASEAREKQRLAHIAGDPFAEDAAESGPRMEGRWISVDDYPPSSLRAREEGITTVQYGVNTSGRIFDCKTIRSSGSAALDRATCQALTRRGSYAPFSMKPGQNVKEYSHTWKLPSD